MYPEERRTALYPFTTPRMAAFKAWQSPPLVSIPIFFIAASSLCIIMIVFYYANPCTPVSYTHLDVYKRQSLTYGAAMVDAASITIQAASEYTMRSTPLV